MGKGWKKGGSRQRKPALCPGKAGEGWDKDGQKVGVVRESPPYAQTRRVKDGKRMVEEWSKAGQKSGQNMLPQPRIPTRK